MQDKMQQHFNSRQEEAESQNSRLLAEIDALVKNVRNTREGLAKDNTTLEQSAKAIKAMISQRKNDNPNHQSPKDLTEALKSHRLRCEIERTFFFHVFYELLRERFGDE